MALDESQIQDYLEARNTASQQEGFDSIAFTKEYSRGLDRGFNRDIGGRKEDDDGGFVKQTATALAGGAVDAAELWMRAIRAIDPDGGSTVIRDFATSGLDSIKNFVAKHPSLSPDANVEKGIKRWWQEGVRSLIPSLVPSLVGGTAGFIGGPGGAAAGAGALSSAIFGLAEYDQFHEDVENRIKELGLSEEEAEAMRAEARNPAIWSAITEGGLEGAANALQVRTLGKFIPGLKGAKGVAKKSIRSLFQQKPKEFLKRAGIQLATTTPVELGTEFAQNALETKFRKDVGLTDMSAMSAGISALGPALVTNLLFFGMGQGAGAIHRYNIKNSLEKAITNPNQRKKAIRNIANTIRDIGGEIDIDGNKVSADEYATRIEKSARGFVNAKIGIDLDSEVGVANTLGQYADALQKGQLSLKLSKKMEKRLEQSLDKEDMSAQERITATQLHQGLGNINKHFTERQEVKDFLNKEELAKKKKEGRRRKGKAIVEANRLEALGDKARGEDIITETELSRSAKELSIEKTEEEQAMVTDFYTERLSNLFATTEEDVKTQLAKERGIIKQETLPVITETRTTGEPVELTRAEQQVGVEQQVAKQTREERAKEKARVLAQPEEETAGPTVTEEATTTEAVEGVTEREPTTEELEAEEVGATTLTETQEKDIRSELRETNIKLKDEKNTKQLDDDLKAQKADLEKALTTAGLDIKKKPTERQRKNIRKGIEKALGREAGVKATGKFQETLKTDPKSFVAQRGKLLQQLTALRKKETSVQNEKQIEEVRTQIKELQDTQNIQTIEDSIIEISNVDEMSIEQIAAEAEAFVQANQIENVPLVSEKGVRTTFLGITPELAQTGQASLKGRKVNGARELAAMAQIYANPQFETLRVFYVKGRTIIHQEGVTSRLPNQVKTFKSDEKAIESKRENMGADKVYLVHNHPSGDPNPSIADKQATTEWNKTIKGLQGHIVINSGKFAFINPTSGESQIAKMETVRPDLEASIPNKIVGDRVKNINDVANLTKRMQNQKGFVNAVYLSSKNDVRSLQEVPVAELETSRGLAKLLRDQAKHSGSARTFITFNTDIHPEAIENSLAFKTLLEQGVLSDVILFNKDNIVSMKQRLGIETKRDSKFFLGERVEAGEFQEESVPLEGEEVFQKQEKTKGKLKRDRVKNDVDDKHVEAKEIREEKLGPGREARTIKQWWKDTTTNVKVKFQQGIVDQYASIQKLDDTIWKLIQQTQSVNGAIETLFSWGPIKLTDGIPDTFGKGNDGLIDVLQPLGNEVEPFLAWVAANRSSKLIKEGRESNLTEDDIKTILATAEGKMKNGDSRLSAWRKANRGLQKLNKSVVDVGIKTGTINKEEASTWENEFYIPLFRHIEENDTQTEGPKTLSGLTDQTAIRRLTGKPVPTSDMLTNIMMNWNHILGSSMKNQAAALTLDKASKNFIEGGEPIARRLDNDMEIKEDKDLKNFSVVDLSGEGEKGTLLGTFDTFEKAQSHMEGRIDKKARALASRGDRMVFIREDGKKVWYEVNEPNIYNSLAGLQWEGFNNSAMKAMRKFKRALTFGVTFSPEFKIRNLIRDSITAVGTSKISKNILTNAIQGGKVTWQDSLMHARIRAGGGFIEFGHVYGTDSEKAAIRIRKDLKNEFILDNPSALKKFLSKSKKSTWDRWNEWGSKLENMNRGALAAQSLEQGESFLEANFQARDLLDFNRQGAFPAVRFLVDTVPFLNARIQGLDKLKRSIAQGGAQRQRALATIGGVAMASMLLYLAFKDDEDFKAREEWDRDTYWWFKVGGEDAYRIPKPFEIGAIGTMAERLLEQFLDDKAHGELFFERLKFALQQTFSFDAVPQVAKPIVELVANKNFFTDRPIETLAMERLSPSQRRKAWTSETAIALSMGMSKIPWEKVQLSPVQVEHLVQGYLGWFGANVIGAVDRVFTQPLGDFPGRPARRVEDYPLLNSFVQTQPARATKYATLFYEQLKEMNETYADIRNFRTIGERDKAIELARESKDKLKFRSLANRRQKLIASYTKRIRLVRLNKTMNAREKRWKIDRLTEIKNRLLKQSVERLQS
jgi:DNA repair protein RadC/uncharacterized protein with HEPN domain